MRDDVSLLLILWVIYLLELLVWIPRRGLFFTSLRNGVFVFAGKFPGNQNGSLRLTHILPMKQLCFIVTQPRLSISCKSISNQPLQHWSRSSGRDAPNIAFNFDEIESVEIGDSVLTINGIKFIDCKTLSEAQRHLELIENLRKVNEYTREEFIRSYYRSRFMDSKGAKARIKTIREETQNFRLTASILFVCALILCPIIYHLYPSPVKLLAFLAYGVLFGWLTTLYFHSAHKRLYPNERNIRFIATLKQIFCFPVAIGSCKDLCLLAFLGIDPLVLAKVTLKEQDFRVLARRVWLDLQYPIQSNWQQSFLLPHSILKEATSEFLTESGYNLADFEKPENGFDEFSVCYCPRCHEQFCKTRETCSECPGVLTIPTNN